MIDIKILRENPEKVEKGISAKNFEIPIGEILDIDETYRKLSANLQELYARRNKVSKERNIEEGRSLKAEINNLEVQVSNAKRDLDLKLSAIPNLPADDVKIGNEEKNEILRKEGEIREFNFKPKDHLDIGEALDIIDVKNAAKVSGARFTYLKNQGALLEFALIQLALEILTKEGFIPIIPPAIIRPEITRGLGYWEAGGNRDYYLVLDPSCKLCGLDLGLQEVVRVVGREKVVQLFDGVYSEPAISQLIMENRIINSLVPIENCPRCGEMLGSNAFYLIGTAEHSIVPMHKDEVLDKKDLPKRYVGFSSSFRRESGTYGKDTRGILRVHQFDKVEMVSFVTEENDDKEHDYLLSLEEKLFQLLEIPYQVVKMCTGDLGFPVARKYDLEAWMPGQNKYREVTSTSTTTDFQSRRLNIKYNNGDEKKFVHVLNGTAFAIGRTIIAILENYQEKNGSILIPKVLQKYLPAGKAGLHFEKITPK